MEDVSNRDFENLQKFMFSCQKKLKEITERVTGKQRPWHWELLPLHDCSILPGISVFFLLPTEFLEEDIPDPAYYDYHKEHYIITFETKALNVWFHSWDEKFDINYQPFDNEEFSDKDVFFDEVLKRWRFKYSFRTDYDDEQYYNDHLNSVELLYRKLDREMK